jgi:hypothetical protein
LRLAGQLDEKADEKAEVTPGSLTGAARPRITRVG